MVQSYYCVYLSIRAYFRAACRSVAPTHEKTLRAIGSDLTSYKLRFPDPWRCVLDGDSNSHGLKLTNSAYTSPLALKNPLTSPHKGDPWQHFMLFLKTTRDRQINSKINTWKQDHNRKLIHAHERAALVSNLRPTSFFDSLYRIRARSNYMDVDSFAFGDVNETASKVLHNAVCELLYCTLFVLEMLIARLIGKAQFDKFVSSFANSKPGSPAGTSIGARWPIMQAFV